MGYTVNESHAETWQDAPEYVVMLEQIEFI
jgi:hypothetical protein